MKYTLVDAEKMSKLHPETFTIPSKDEIKTIKIGSSVKLCFDEKERMWVTVTKIIDFEKFEGTLDNDPLLVSLKYGDKIHFDAKNIYNIFQE